MIDIPRRKRNTTLPDLINDPVLGQVRYLHALDGMDEYEASTKVNRRDVTLNLYTDENGTLRKCIDRARKIVKRLPIDLVRMNKFMESSVLFECNSIWREGQKPLTARQFLRKVKLQMITTHPYPRATYWFDVGDLLGGHILQIEVGERFRILGYSTPG